MPQVSAELRWFLDAAHAEESEAFGRWFRGGAPPPGGGEPRDDVYALDDSTEEIGVKSRGEKPGLEIKALVVPELCALEFGGRSGQVQIWSKVTSKVLALPDGDGARRATRKTRWLRKLDASGSRATEIALGAGKRREDPLKGSRPDLGCNVEWTSVEILGSSRTWWTFGLEAFAYKQPGGLAPILEDCLRKAVAALEKHHGAPPRLVNAWKEWSYPAWLAHAEEEGSSK